MKQFSQIVIRYGKTKTSFLAFLALVAIKLWLPKLCKPVWDLTATSHRRYLMLTKRQTLWALPILIATFAALCLTGYALEKGLSIKSDGLTAVVGAALVANLFALIFIVFSIFMSFGTALVFNASSPDFWQRTGNPFYYLLWRELREATGQRSDESVN